MLVVAGVYASVEPATRAIAAVRDAGCRLERVRLIADEPGAAARAAPGTVTEILGGVGGGIGLGSVLGSIGGWLAEWSEEAIEDLVELLATGPFAAFLDDADPLILAGAGIGAFAGGLLGLHAGNTAGSRADGVYAERVAAGAVMVRLEVASHRDACLARRLLRRHGASHVRWGV
jgi:hypothetical protein